MPDVVQSSYLLCLSAELRNQIWGYVLTTPYNLRYQDPASRIRFLYERVLSTQKQKTSNPMLYSNPDTQAVSELFVEATRRAKTQAPDAFNQLKYVSKQLYQETNALELQYNNLSFACRSRNERLASFQLISFMDALPTFQKLWLRTIVLNDKNPRAGVQGPDEDICFPFDSPRTIAKLGQICRHNPQISCRYIITAWTAGLRFQNYRYDGIYFVLRGLCLESALRQQDHFTSEMSAAFSRDLYLEPEILKWRRSVPVDSFQAPNLRFMPGGNLVWDAQAWHDWAITVAPASPKKVDWVMKHMKEWIEQGI